MARIIIEKTINAPLETVWASWDDYANIDKFNPGVRSSYLIGKTNPTGLGALRQCNFTDGKTFVREKIVGYEVNKKLVLDIYESNAPIKEAMATLKFSAIHASQSHITMTMNFTPKMGLLGKIMTPLMKMQFTKALNGLLEGNAFYVEKNFNLDAAA